MARANSGEAAVEMCFDSADGHVGYFGDIVEVKLFYEAQDEDGSLALGERFDRLPDECYLFLGYECVLCGGDVIADEACELVGVDGGSCNVPPKAEAIRAGVVTDEVQSDASEPGGGSAVAPELVSRDPGAEEGVLGERLSEVAISYAGEEEAEDALAIKLVHAFNGAESNGHSCRSGLSRGVGGECLRVEEVRDG